LLVNAGLHDRLDFDAISSGQSGVSRLEAVRAFNSGKKRVISNCRQWTRRLVWRFHCSSSASTAGLDRGSAFPTGPKRCIRLGSVYPSAPKMPLDHKQRPRECLGKPDPTLHIIRDNHHFAAVHHQHLALYLGSCPLVHLYAVRDTFLDQTLSFPPQTYLLNRNNGC
jgi:hypothetical protein